MKVTLSREIEAAKLVYGQHEYKDFSLKSILISPKTEGYIYVEADTRADVLRATEDVKLAKKVVESPLSCSEMKDLVNVQWTSVSRTQPSRIRKSVGK